MFFLELSCIRGRPKNRITYVCGRPKHRVTYIRVRLKKPLISLTMHPTNLTYGGVDLLIITYFQTNYFDNLFDYFLVMFFLELSCIRGRPKNRITYVCGRPKHRVTYIRGRPKPRSL